MPGAKTGGWERRPGGIHRVTFRKLAICEGQFDPSLPVFESLKELQGMKRF